jgi:methionyl-tRNA formyltransferase
MTRRVVVLSSQVEFTRALLQALNERGIRPDAVVLCVPGLAREWRSLPSAARRLRALPLLPLRWVSRRLGPRLDRRLRVGAQRVVLTGPPNGARMAKVLRRLDPDMVVLARCAIILDPSVLSIAREGVVNVHPGLLPWIRGNSPLTHSVLRGVPLGASAFRVDPGIDTGPVLERRLLPVRGGETTVQLWGALHRLWVEMTADLVRTALAGAIGPGTPQPGRFPLCRNATPAERDAAAEAVRRGEARALFERWLPLCDPVHLSLPLDADAEFVPRAAG